VASKIIMKEVYLTIHHSLQIIPRIPFCSTHILPHIPPESQYHIDNNRGPHRKDGSIHKILTDFACRNPHPVADS
jgi:hypothetical protein